MGLCIKLINNIDGNCQLNHHHHYHSSTTFQPLPSLALKCEMGNHHHASLSGFDVMGVFQPPTDPPSYRKARQGVWYAPHTLSHFNTMEVFQPPSNPPLHWKEKRGLWHPFPHLPLMFWHDRGVSTTHQLFLVSKSERGGSGTHSHTPLTFRCDGGVSTTLQPSLVLKSKTGASGTPSPHPKHAQNGTFQCPLPFQSFPQLKCISSAFFVIIASCSIQVIFSCHNYFI